MKSSPSLARSEPENGSASLQDRVRSLRLDDRAGSKRKGSSILPWALCVILLAMTAAFGYRAYRITPAAPVQSEAPRPVDTTALVPQETAESGEVVLQSKGYVIPAHQVQVSPKAGGQIVQLNPRFKEGEYFEKGEVLAWLEEDDYRADLAHAWSALAGAEQRYMELLNGNRDEEKEQARFELEEAMKTMEQLRLDEVRSRRLITESALGQRDYELAKFTYDAMARRVQRLRTAYQLMLKGQRDERIRAARAEWEAAEADWQKAEWRLENCKIRAPIAGHILSKKAEKGNVVNPLAFNVSASLCEMADLGDLEVDLTIQERDIAAVSQGQQCTIMPEAFQKYEPFRKLHPRGYMGDVSRLMPTADRAKGAVPVRVKVLIPSNEVGRYLKPEMSVLVSFLRGKPGDAASKESLPPSSRNGAVSARRGAGSK